MSRADPNSKENDESKMFLCTEGLMKRMLVSSILVCSVFVILSTISFGISWFEKEKEVPMSISQNYLLLNFLTRA